MTGPSGPRAPILLTVGTILPFDRLTQAVDEWAAAHPAQPVFGQVCALGDNHYRPRNMAWAERLSPTEFRAAVRAAPVIVAHAGIGTMTDALMHRKPLIVLARRHDLHEHVNDHQLQTVARFRTRPGIWVVDTPDAIGPALDHLTRHPVDIPALGPHAEPGLIDAVRHAIFDLRP